MRNVAGRTSLAGNGPWRSLNPEGNYALQRVKLGEGPFRCWLHVACRGSDVPGASGLARDAGRADLDADGGGPLGSASSGRRLLRPDDGGPHSRGMLCGPVGKAWGDHCQD